MKAITTLMEAKDRTKTMASLRNDSGSDFGSDSDANLRRFHIATITVFYHAFYDHPCPATARRNVTIS